jgi:predicted RNA-binding Zn ribbon-like protein
VTTLSAETAGLDYIRHSIVLHAVGLLETLPIERLRMCAGTQCGWLFLDTSKAGSRRWCDTATCGNAAKTRARAQRTLHRQRRL